MKTWGDLSAQTWAEAFPARWRVAVLGAGPRATGIASVWQERRDCEVIGLCDPVKETVEPQAKKLGVRAFTDPVALLAEHAHVVINATRSPLHYPLTLLALEAAQAAVLVEKPLADTPAHAWRLVDLAHAHILPLIVSHQTSCTPPVTKALAMLRSGEIGDLLAVSITGKGYYGGYELFNMTPHYLNVAMLFTGDVTRVRDVTGRELTRVPQPAYAPYGFGVTVWPNLEIEMETVTGTPVRLHLQQRDPPSAGHMAVDIHGSKKVLRLYWKWWLHQRPQVDGPNDHPWQPVEIPKEDRTLHGIDFTHRQAGDDWLAEMMVQQLRGELLEHPASARRAAVGVSAMHAAIASNGEWQEAGPKTASVRWGGELDPRLSILRYNEWAARANWLGGEP